MHAYKYRFMDMLRPSKNREFAFILNDVARLLRTYADYRAAQFGMTRAQWAVLVRLDLYEGLNQSELAEMLDLQPITLTRLLDKLCDSGLIERRPDPDDRRAKRLFLTRAARPLLEQLAALGEETMANTLEGVEPAQVEQMVSQLEVVRDNLRQLIQKRNAHAATATASRERHYG
jgi:MarR family transcriptional regulator for hemolysin